MWQKDQEEKELRNGHNLKKLKYHCECEIEQFQRNEICEILIDIQTYGH